jgi:addiction module RelE/StbE family toxin
MNIAFSTVFNKNYNKLSKKIQNKFDEKIQIFEIDEFDLVFKNHKLHGEYDGCRSINITGDIRAIYKKISERDYYFYDIGTHSKLYS